MTDTTARMRVLVADDNEDAADSLAFLLRLWGHDVSVAYDGEQALRAAAATPPDCMILDINMPHLDGYGVARRVREDPAMSKAKLVTLTACHGDDHERLAREAGFDYLLRKPADPQALQEVLAMIEQVLELAARTKQLAQENVEIAKETKQVIEGAKADLTEVREKIADVAEGLREVKEELREVKDAIRNPPSD